ALQTTNTTLTQVFAVEPGETYTLSACAKSAGGRCTVGVDFMWGPTDNEMIRNGAYELVFPQNTEYYNNSSVTFTTTEETTYLKVYVWSDVNVTAQIDEISLEHVVAGDTTASVPLTLPNDNGRFESGALEAVWNTNCVIAAEGANESAHALQLQNHGGMGFHIPATAGEQYVISGWGRVDTEGENFSFGINCQDANGNNIPGGRAEIFSTSTTYEQKSRTFTAPAGTTLMEIFAWKQSGTGLAYLDDITVSQVYRETTIQPEGLQHAGGSTVFNDHSMDGLLYFHTGDLRYAAMELAGQLDTEYVGGDRANDVYYFNPVRYGGNDITDDKRKALISFLSASYPIVVSDELFESPAKVFQEANYEGYSVDLETGTYTLDQLETLGIEGNVISSLRVSEGYRVTVFTGSNFDGASYTFDADSNYVGNRYNDQINSIRVETIEGREADRIHRIDQEHVDNSSYMFEFLTAAMGQNNFYVRSEIGADSKPFQFYLNRPKVSVANVQANGNVTAEGVYDIYPDTNGRYTLEYRFTIENEGAASANTQYACQLFVDVNADGKYSSNEELSDVSLTYNGETVSATNLYIGREYVLRRTVPDGYKGVLPWKIQISQVNNPHIHNGVTGYTKLRGLERETLRILQVCRDQVTDRDWWHGANEVLFNLESKIADPEDIYHVLIYGGEYAGVTYEGIYRDFDIDVDFMKISEFETAYTANNDLLKNYNMLILGFSDAYGNISGDAESGPIGAIVDFIEGGKSVLFAHDTVSYFNYEDGKRGALDIDGTTTFLTDQYHNSYALTKYVRGLVGMDRYGITEIADLKLGTGMTADSPAWNLVSDNKKEYAYVPGTNRTQTYGLTQGYTYSAINAKDRNVVYGSNGLELGSGSHQTFSAQYTRAGEFTNTYLNLDYGTVYYKEDLYDDGEIYDTYNGEVTNLWVTQVNNGQITDYPYKLEEEFMVSSTHGQYYQLDFMADDDNDEQTDLVVWYCLGYRTNGSGVRQETIYSMSPNDVANNYYIYNKGNITYTGVGHAAFQDVTSTVEEAKLFINTMIASYNAGIKSPVITTLREGDVNADVLNSSHMYYDEENDLLFDSNEATVSDIEGMNKIFFTVSDPNFVKGTRTIAARFLYESDDADAEAISYNGQIINVKELGAEVYDASTNQRVEATDNLSSGGVYYILFDKSIMGDFEAKFTIYFEAQTTIIANNTVTQTDKSYSTFDYTKVQLFNLK
uniref:DUF5057 domain-containing protein n=1 Tax=Acetatifactor sp. TaxID=1872090 RepID=UPI004056A4D9